MISWDVCLAAAALRLSRQGHFSPPALRPGPSAAASLCLESLSPISQKQEVGKARPVSDPHDAGGKHPWTRGPADMDEDSTMALHGSLAAWRGRGTPGGQARLLLPPLLLWLLLVQLPGADPFCPESCQCFGNVTVFCSEECLAHVPEEIPDNATQLFFVETSLGSLLSGAFANGSSGNAALRKLVFLCSPLHSLGEGAFAGLTGLQELAISSSRLTRLHAESFCGLGSLSVLSVQFSPVETLEEEVFHNTPALQELHLRGNRIRALLPGVFHPVGGLETLSLSQNGLSSLPEGVFDPLPQLRVLRLSDNNLSCLPFEIFHSQTDLRELYLDGNALAELPEGVFSEQTRLRRLHLQHNALQELPVALFSSMANLTFLHLDGNQLKVLPEGLFLGTPSLVELSVAHNQLETLPEGLFGALLPNLSVLTLSHNRLHHLPASIFQGLQALTRLQLGHNNLSGLPRELLANLSSLEALDLSHNQLVTVPEGIFDYSFALFYIALRGNPWACDCHLLYLADWLQYADDLVNAHALCGSPTHLKGLSLPGVKKEQLVCPRRPSGSVRCRVEDKVSSEEGEASALSQCAYHDPEGTLHLACGPDACQQLRVTLPAAKGTGQHLSGNWTLGSGCGTLRVRVSVTIEKEEPFNGTEGP
ncbi:carboxypeptidase N subunit 2-like [Anolis sagrei]|uniref:carboxypeptidase N subunit 2-like n=1 Tax=Anolis sagrei TaxID=38937 RepID=UPI003521C776